ncbi:hypothetical protein LCGC14_2770560, partial [marine sediment metagenome]
SQIHLPGGPFKKGDLFIMFAHAFSFGESPPARLPTVCLPRCAVIGVTFAIQYRARQYICYTVLSLCYAKPNVALPCPAYAIPCFTVLHLCYALLDWTVPLLRSTTLPVLIMVSNPIKTSFVASTCPECIALFNSGSSFGTNRIRPFRLIQTNPSMFFIFYLIIVAPT